MNFKVKIGKLADLTQLQKQGIVYCNTLKYFTELEDGQIRGDKHENAFEFKTFENPELLIKPANDPNAVFKKLNLTWSQMITRNSDPYGNIYCLYCVDMTNIVGEGQLNIDVRNGSFGAHALVFLNSEKFEERLYNELDRKKMKYHFGHVNYIRLKYHNGKKSLFQKDIEYSYQKEYRIFIENNEQKPLILKIGDISDITQMYEFETFKQLKYMRP